VKNAFRIAAFAALAFCVLPSAMAAAPPGDVAGTTIAEPIEEGGATPRQQTRSRASYDVILPAADSTGREIVWSEPPLEAPEGLVEAIAIVTQSDPSAQAAWMGVRASVFDLEGTRWLRYPSLTTDLGVANATNPVLPSVTVELPIWTGGQIGAAIRRGQDLKLASLAQWHETVLDLALEVNRTYFDIALFSRLEGLYSESLGEHESLVASMERRVSQEVSPLADLELVRSRTAQIEQELTLISSQRLTALQNLAELVRNPGYRIGPIPAFEPAQANWNGIVGEAVEYSPARARLLFQSDAVQSEASIARASILPRLSAQYSYNEITGSRLGIGLRLQTQSGLSQFSAVSSANARYTQSLDQVRLAERQLRQEIANEVVTFDAAVQRTRAFRDAAQTAGRVSESFMRQFIAGRRSWLDVMNQIRENLSARAGLAQAEVLAQSTAVRLHLRSGRWKPLLKSPEQ
jgi:adhesin transport system outer membrane protein